MCRQELCRLRRLAGTIGILALLLLLLRSKCDDGIHVCDAHEEYNQIREETVRSPGVFASCSSTRQKLGRVWNW